MYQVEKTFYELTLREGGLTQASEIVGPVGDAVQWIDEKFEWEIKLLLSSLDNHTHGWIKSLDLQWINNPAINAFAYLGVERCYIGFYVGIASRLRHVFYAAALNPFIFENIPGSWVIEAGAPFREWSDTLVNLIAGERLSEHTTAYLEKEINQPINEQRKKLAMDLYEAAVDFLLLHEIHHFWLGHVYGLDPFRKLGISEASVGKNPDAPYTLRRMIETHADIYASRHAFGLIRILEKKEKMSATTNWWIAVAILFMTLEPDPVAYDQWDMQQYAHPHLRLASLFNWTQAVISGLEWDDVEMDSMNDEWIGVLTRIDVLSKGKIAFPLREMLNEREMYGKEIDEWTKTYQVNATVLDEGQAAMLRFFNK